MPEHKSLGEALLAAKLEMPALKRDAVNPHFKSKFISLGSLTDTVEPVLLKHGLLWSTFPCVDANGNPALRYSLTHVPSGETIGDTMLLLLGKQDPQGQGSATTYGRRYALQAVLDLVADSDDDGEAASSKNGTELASKEDVDSMVAAARGLSSDQVKLALAACGLDGLTTYGQVPRAKTAQLAKKLAGIER